MSYTIFTSMATCQMENLGTSEEVALSVYDYCVKHPDKIPPVLDECDSDEFVFEIQHYIHCDVSELLPEDHNLMIYWDTEDENCCNKQVFDFLINHFMLLQSSKYMKVAWSMTDSRTGNKVGIDFYNQKGQKIDVESLISFYQD